MSPSSSSSYHTRNGRTCKRGAYLNRLWYCDCDPRLPADKFQTKNGGKNHGRWFYTCPQPQHKRCAFFLWVDDAKLREDGGGVVVAAAAAAAAAGPVTSTNTTAPAQQPMPPQTPRRQAQQTLLQPPLTPQSRPRLMARLRATTTGQTTSAKADAQAEAEAKEGATPSKPPTDPPRPGGSLSRASSDEFGWSSGNDEDLASALDLFETPRKHPASPPGTAEKAAAAAAAAVGPGSSSPSKRPFSAMKESSNGGDDGSVFTTPPSRRHPTTITTNNGLTSPSPQTPPTSSSSMPTGPRPRAGGLLSGSTTETLTSQVLAVLAPHSLPPATISSVTELLASYELRTAGIARGRDLTRLALQQKADKIAELQSCVQALEHERDMLRNAITLLKSDLATNTKQRGGPRRPRGGGGRGGGGGWGGGGGGGGDPRRAERGGISE